MRRLKPAIAQSAPRPVAALQHLQEALLLSLISHPTSCQFGRGRCAGLAVCAPMCATNHSAETPRQSLASIGAACLTSACVCPPLRRSSCLGVFMLVWADEPSKTHMRVWKSVLSLQVYLRCSAHSAALSQAGPSPLPAGRNMFLRIGGAAAVDDLIPSQRGDNRCPNTKRRAELQCNPSG